MAAIAINRGSRSDTPIEDVRLKGLVDGHGRGWVDGHGRGSLAGSIQGIVENSDAQRSGRASGFGWADNFGINE